MKPITCSKSIQFWDQLALLFFFFSFFLLFVIVQYLVLHLICINITTKDRTKLVIWLFFSFIYNLDQYYHWGLFSKVPLKNNKLCIYIYSFFFNFICFFIKGTSIFLWNMWNSSILIASSQYMLWRILSHKFHIKSHDSKLNFTHYLDLHIILRILASINF